MSNWRDAIASKLSRQVEEELKDGIPDDERVVSIAIIVFGVLMGLYFAAHQRWSTGFFTARFATLEALLLYGSLVYWVVASALLLIGQKNLSRNLDSYGGLAFAAFGIAWLLVVFPFDFARFADALPGLLQVFLRWISNGIAWVLMVLAFTAHLALAVYSLIVRMLVRQVRARKG